MKRRANEDCDTKLEDRRAVGPSHDVGVIRAAVTTVVTRHVYR